MDIFEAKRQAIYHMTKHNLIQTGWKFQLDTAKRRFGYCSYTRKIISLSQPLTTVNNEVEVLDTILHEIAHALTPKAHHGPIWMAKCIELGCRPVRCYTTVNVIAVASRYKAKCGACGSLFERLKQVKRFRRVACRCQNKLPWNEKVLLIYIDTQR